MKSKEVISPFHQVAESLLNKGLLVMPLVENKKACFVKDWTNLTIDLSREYLTKPSVYNVGLVCGKSSGIIALDFDNNIDSLHQKVLKICGQSPVVKKGKKGGTIFFRYAGESSKKWQKDGQMVVELLSDGTQTVIPPSIHPETMQPYIYTKGVSLVDVDINTLPFLPTDFEERVTALFQNKEVVSSRSSLDVIKEALYFVAPTDYDTWLRCGMALKNDFVDEGYSVWEKWSSTDPRFDPKDTLSKWESFKKDGLSSATIISLARENGYIPTKNTSSFFNVDNAKLEFDRWRLKGRPVGLSSGIVEFDKLLHLRDKEFTLVTGTPNSGKSEFVDFLVYNLVTNHKVKAMFCSFEKDPTDHIESFVHRIVGKDLISRTQQEESVALDAIRNNMFFYNHLYESRDIDDVLVRAKDLVTKVGLKYLIIDPFSYVTSKEIASEFAHVRYVCIQLTKFAKNNKVHVILVAHPKTLDTKSGITPKLTLYSVSGGANFYNKCDNGIVISRDNTELTVDIQKVRQQEIDSLGSFTLTYDKSKRFFNNYIAEF